MIRKDMDLEFGRKQWQSVEYNVKVKLPSNK
jgi:hypothetical protein